MSKLAILGITGRMGRALLDVLHEQSDLVLSGALASPGSSALGRSGGPTKKQSVLAIGRAPRPAPSTSRMTPPMPVPAPP